MFDHRQPGNPHGLAHPFHPDCTGESASWCPVHGDCSCHCENCVEGDVTLCSWADHVECEMLNDDRCRLHEYLPDKDYVDQQFRSFKHRGEIVYLIRERIG